MLFMRVRNQKKNINSKVTAVVHILGTRAQSCHSRNNLLSIKKFTANNPKQPPEVFYKKSFLKISQNSNENTCSSLFFNKVAG